MQNKWLWTCGVGCGALIVIVGLASVGIATQGVKLRSKAVSTLKEGLRTQYEQRKKEGKVKKELQDPIEELITLLERPETPLMAALSVIGITAEILDNESIGIDLALPALNDFRNLFKNKAVPTLDEIADVVDKHNALMEALDKKPPKKSEGSKDESQQPSTGG